jgi:hypothetical protein
MFNAISTRNPLIMEEKLDFVLSPTIERNIPNQGEEFPKSPSKDPFSTNIDPSF